jgi:hypothetical protein
MMAMSLVKLANPDIARRRAHNVLDLLTLQLLNQEPIINCSVTMCPCGFMNNILFLTKYIVPKIQIFHAIPGLLKLIKKLI